MSASLLASAASAGTLSVNWATENYLGDSGTFHEGVSVSSTSPSKSYNGQGGAYSVTASGYTQNGTFIAWCLDLLDSVSIPGFYNNVYDQLSLGDGAFSDNELGAIREAALVKYFNHNYSKVVDSETGAAFQLGLWEIVYEAPGAASSLLTGNFKASDSDPTPPNQIDWANSFLAALTAPGESELEEGGQTFSLIFWDSDGVRQDLVSGFITSLTVGDVPLPAAGWLLGGGLLGLFGYGRMRKQTA